MRLKFVWFPCFCLSTLSLIGQCDLVPGQLMPNCDFEMDIGTWVADNGVISFDSSEGHNALGSMQSLSEAVGAWTWSSPKICVAVAGSTTYGVGFDVKMTSAPVSGTPFAQVRYVQYEDASCSVTQNGASLVAAGSQFSIMDGNWNQSTGSLTTESWVQFIEIEFRVLNQEGNGADHAFTVHYDDGFLGVGFTPAELVEISVE